MGTKEDCYIEACWHQSWET